MNIGATSRWQQGWEGLARGISHALSPAGVVALVLAAAASSARLAWPTAAVGVVLFAVVPAAALLALRARSGRGEIYDLPRDARQRLLMAGTGCYAAGWAVTVALGLGTALAWVGATFTAGAAAVWAIDRAWKISIHNTGAGGGAILLSGFLEPSLRPLCLALPLMVGWARWRRGAHTPAQLLAGAALGAALAWGLGGLHR